MQFFCFVCVCVCVCVCCFLHFTLPTYWGWEGERERFASTRIKMEQHFMNKLNRHMAYKNSRFYYAHKMNMHNHELFMWCTVKTYDHLKRTAWNENKLTHTHTHTHMHTHKHTTFIQGGIWGTVTKTVKYNRAPNPSRLHFHLFLFN